MLGRKAGLWKALNAGGATQNLKPIIEWRNPRRSSKQASLSRNVAILVHGHRLTRMSHMPPGCLPLRASNLSTRFKSIHLLRRWWGTAAAPLR